MAARYDILKVATIAGTFFSVYHAFIDKLLLEDLLIVLLIAIAFVAVARDLEKKKKKQKSKAEIPRELAETVEEAIKEQVTA